jgi:hypothetical protein
MSMKRLAAVSFFIIGNFHYSDIHFDINIITLAF